MEHVLGVHSHFLLLQGPLKFITNPLKGEQSLGEKIRKSGDASNPISKG